MFQAGNISLLASRCLVKHRQCYVHTFKSRTMHLCNGVQAKPRKLPLSDRNKSKPELGLGLGLGQALFQDLKSY